MSEQEIIALAFVLSSFVGFLVFYLLSHPNSRVHHKLPKIQIKWLELLPSVRITISGKVFHIHHWFGFSIILVISILIDTGILGSVFTKGFLAGGIVQGIFTPHSGKLVYKKKDND